MFTKPPIDDASLAFYVRLLGIEPAATTDEIEKAQVRSLRITHPDRHAGSVEAERLSKLVREARDGLVAWKTWEGEGGIEQIVATLSSMERMPIEEKTKVMNAYGELPNLATMHPRVVQAMAKVLVRELEPVVGRRGAPLARTWSR
jgi:hypothetical protein